MYFQEVDSKYVCLFINDLHNAVFVANRVADIESNQWQLQWHYVPSHENPADAASLEIKPDNPLDLKLWWKGPHWLSKPPDEWPSSREQPVEINLSPSHEIRHTRCYQVQIEPSSLTRFSSLNRMNRTVAWCLRFRSNQTRPREWKALTIQATELREAFLHCVRYSQRMDFRDDIKALSEGRALSRRSRSPSWTHSWTRTALYFIYYFTISSIRAGGSLSPYDMALIYRASSHNRMPPFFLLTNLRGLQYWLCERSIIPKSSSFFISAPTAVRWCIGTG